MGSLTTIFQASVYGILVLSAIILADAEEALFPQGLTVPLAMAAWILTERKKKIQLPVWGANVLGLGGLLLSIAELLSNNLEARLLSGAHMLVYLSWVVLFQAKGARQYWWMCSLSVLQVAVGSVLTTSGTYGILLVIYFCGAIWTLSLFSLWQAWERIRLAQEPAAIDGNGAAGAFAAGPFGALQQPSMARSAVEHDGEERWLSFRFFGGTLATSGAAILVAGLFFMLVPRVWVSAPTFGTETMLPAGNAVTGFSEEVRLGDMGRIMESSELVMSIALFDQQTDEPIDVYAYTARLGLEEPLFRGAVLSFYDRGDWKAGNIGNRPEIIRMRPRRSESRIRHEVMLRPVGSHILLAMQPVLEGRADETNAILRFPSNSILSYPDRTRSRRTVRYVLYSPPANSPDEQLTPLSELSPRLREMQRSLLTQFPSTGLERLREKAIQVARLDAAGERPGDRVIADRLIAFLRDSGEFSYSLDTSIANGQIDPVEDFLFVRKAGHCQYFASALALMLRANGIPSRVVSGFKGGKVNSVSIQFEVEQRHAHAWVEGYLDDRWVTLDATPADERLESVESMQASVPTFRDLVTFIQDFWNTHVVNMNIGQQRNSVYGPLQAIGEDLWRTAKGEESPRKLWEAVKAFLMSPEDWFSLGGGLISFVLLLLMAGAVWCGRRLWAILRVWRPKRARRRGTEESLVEFYERFRKLCKKSGLTRQESQTHREFGRLVEERWAAELKADGLNSLPSELVELFYRVRFGEVNVSEAELERLERGLSGMEAAISKPNRAAGRPLAVNGSVPVNGSAPTNGSVHANGNAARRDDVPRDPNSDSAVRG